MASGSILIIDDDPDVLSALKVALEDDFRKIQVEHNVSRIPTAINESFDVVLLDMNFSAGINSGNEGLYWLGKIKEIHPEAAVVMMTAYGNISLAVEAIKRGAKDFVLKPWDNEKLIATLKTSMSARKTVAPTIQDNIAFFKGASPAIVELQDKIDKVAPTDASILILGENGTGKDVVAREIHSKSLRKDKVFMAVDLSTLTPGLFESELFGHKKGSFTDARSDRKGRFESANGGTLFLDEVGNIPLQHQAKLLTVLQNRQTIPVGSNDPIQFNVRLISATNSAIHEMVDSGEFRQDLLYRLNTITIVVPPLRERPEDIIGMAEFFLKKFSLVYKKQNLKFHPEAKEAMLKYRWPGNVRELEHTVEKSVILCDDLISGKDLNLSISAKAEASALRTLDDIEKEALVMALKTYDGNIVQAAKALGITRQTFYNKMKKYGI